MSVLQKFAQKRSSLITKSCPICPIGAHLIWTSPIYRFIIEDEIDENDKQTYKEIYIDVTGSIPSSLTTPSKEMCKVFDYVLSKFPKKSKPLILDFGAGNLRNTFYLLNKGYNVHAVEYKKNDETITKKHEKTKKLNGEFKNLVFPHDFFNTKIKFDLILLINVCTIMPVPSERYLVLQYCRDRLEDDGYLLWFTIHRDKNNDKRCTDDVKIGDGHYFGKNLRYQTFYRDLYRHEIDRMFYSSGFRLDDPQKRISAGHNIARLYKKVGNNPISTNVINAEIIREYVIGEEQLKVKLKTGVPILKNSDGIDIKVNDPNPFELSEEQIYIDALTKLPKGTGFDKEYQNLIYAILLKLFMPPLDIPKIEYRTDDGGNRIDIIMRNNTKNGFFKEITEDHRQKIYAPWIIIECKNYSKDIGNPEISQIIQRFGDDRGKFGFIIFRDSKNKRQILKKCVDHRNKNKDEYIIPLDDEDIIEMLTLKLHGEGIDDFLSEKLQSLIFNN